MRNTILSIIVIAFLASFAAGCSSAEIPTGTFLPSPGPTEPTATETVAPRSAQLEGFIEYTQTGGIAGIYEQWRFFADGRVIDAEGVEYEISEAETADLLAEIEAMGFYDWEIGPRRLSSCADCFAYTINANYDGQSNELTFVDAQADVPEGVWIILDRIQALLRTISEG